MSNPFYSFLVPFVASGTAKSGDLNNEFTNIQGAFDAVNVLVGNAAEFAAGAGGNSGSAATISFANGRFQILVLTNTCTLTVGAAPAVGEYHLKLVQDATGSRTITWVGFDANHCVGNSFPTIASAANGVTMVTLYWDGTVYWVKATNWD